MSLYSGFCSGYTYCFGNPFKYTDPSGENPLSDFGYFCKRAWWTLTGKDPSARGISAGYTPISFDLDFSWGSGGGEVHSFFEGVSLEEGDMGSSGFFDPFPTGGGGGGSGAGRSFGSPNDIAGDENKPGPTMPFTAWHVAPFNIRAHGKGPRNLMDNAFNKAGIKLNWYRAGEIYTLTGFEAMEGILFDRRMASRLGTILNSGMALDIKMSPTPDGRKSSYFITPGNPFLPVEVYFDKAPQKKFYESEEGKSFYNFTRFSAEEHVIHEILGHAYQWAAGLFQTMSVSQSESDAVGFTNYYRTFYLGKPRRIYYNDSIQLDFYGAHPIP